MWGYSISIRYRLLEYPVKFRCNLRTGTCRLCWLGKQAGPCACPVPVPVPVHATVPVSASLQHSMAGTFFSRYSATILDGFLRVTCHSDSTRVLCIHGTNGTSTCGTTMYGITSILTVRTYAKTPVSRPPRARPRSLACISPVVLRTLAQSGLA